VTLRSGGGPCLLNGYDLLTASVPQMMQEAAEHLAYCEDALRPRLTESRESRVE